MPGVQQMGEVIDRHPKHIAMLVKRYMEEWVKGGDKLAHQFYYRCVTMPMRPAVREQVAKRLKARGVPIKT